MIKANNLIKIYNYTKTLKSTLKEGGVDIDELTPILLIIFSVLVLLLVIISCVRAARAERHAREAVNQREQAQDIASAEASEANKMLRARLLKEQEYYKKRKSHHARPANFFKNRLGKEGAENSLNMSYDDWQQGFGGVVSKKALTLSISDELSDKQRKAVNGRRRINKKGFMYDKESLPKQDFDVLKENFGNGFGGSVLVNNGTANLTPNKEELVSRKRIMSHGAIVIDEETGRKTISRMGEDEDGEDDIARLGDGDVEIVEFGAGGEDFSYNLDAIDEEKE